MSDLVAEALAPFHYPPEIHAHLAAIVENMRAVLPLRVALLLGSAARGELSFRRRNGRLEMFSDYELYAITARQPLPTEVRKLNRTLEQLTEGWGVPGPFFHVDVSVNSERLFWAKLRRDRRISTFEVASNARAIAGEPVDLSRLVFPANRLDLGNTNELVLVRLWMQLLFTPRRVILGEASQIEADAFKFGLNRNMLDVLTIFLPNRGILLPGYRLRLSRFEAHPDLQSALPPDTLFWQQAALQAKLALEMPERPEVYQRAFLAQYVGLLNCLLKRDQSAGPPTLAALDDLAAAVRASRGRFMADRPIPRIRRARREVRLFRQVLRGQGATAAVQWIRLPRRPEMIVFLLYLHFATGAILTGNPDAGSALDRAAAVLKRLSPLPTLSVGTDGNVRETWLALRNEFARFMTLWMYNDRHYLERWGILNWTADDS